MKPRAIYFHFPFCETRCHYCDFYSIAEKRTSREERNDFAHALRREIEILEIDCSELDSIFLGGGTPSTTSPEIMAEIFEPIHSKLKRASEWTMEANPSSIDLERMRGYRSLGVNRVSVGVQAMQDHHLKNLGRPHDSKMVFDALDAVFQADFKNVSVDLICGVPHQTLAELKESMDVLTRFPITHVSCYLLTLNKTHRMYPDLPNEETQLEHLLWIDEYLAEKGFRHYEISNFCREGQRAEHNMHYWSGNSYIGLGPSAHSFDREKSKRWKNFSSLKQYMSHLQNSKLPIEWEEKLNDDQKDLEKWILATRLDEGFPKNWLKPNSISIDQLIENRLIEMHPNESANYRLTAKGFALNDQIIQTLAFEQ